MRHITLTHFLVEEQRAGHVCPELRLQIEMMARAVTSISAQVSRGPLTGMLGEAGSSNVQGEEQKKLDIVSNEIVLRTNEWGGCLAAMASEEMETIFPIPSEFPQGELLLLFDPLDGSSNIDVNVSVGTIFSVLRSPNPGTPPVENDFLQPGTQQLAAGYAIYGPSTQLILTVGKGVHGFTLDRESGTFIQSTAFMKVPEQTQEYAINASNVRFWEAPVQRYITELQQGTEGPRGKNFNMRWIASMVADVHRILTRGGIFMYPMDEKVRAQGGKLRLMYEANPMALLVEQAGGLATTGGERILDIRPEKLHQRVPVILGSRVEVERVTAYHAAR